MDKKAKITQIIPMNGGGYDILLFCCGTTFRSLKKFATLDQVSIAFNISMHDAKVLLLIK